MVDSFERSFGMTIGWLFGVVTIMACMASCAVAAILSLVGCLPLMLGFLASRGYIK